MVYGVSGAGSMMGAVGMTGSKKMMSAAANQTSPYGGVPTTGDSFDASGNFAGETGNITAQLLPLLTQLVQLVISLLGGAGAAEGNTGNGGLIEAQPGISGMPAQQGALPQPGAPLNPGGVTPGQFPVGRGLMFPQTNGVPASPFAGVSPPVFNQVSPLNPGGVTPGQFPVGRGLMFPMVNGLPVSPTF